VAADGLVYSCGSFRSLAEQEVARRDVEHAGREARDRTVEIGQAARHLRLRRDQFQCGVDDAGLRCYSGVCRCAQPSALTIS
jgi:hypothetical protein